MFMCARRLLALFALGGTFVLLVGTRLPHAPGIGFPTWRDFWQWEPAGVDEFNHQRVGMIFLPSILCDRLVR